MIFLNYEVQNLRQDGTSETSYTFTYDAFFVVEFLRWQNSGTNSRVRFESNAGTFINSSSGPRDFEIANITTLNGTAFFAKSGDTIYLRGPGATGTYPTNNNEINVHVYQIQTGV